MLYWILLVGATLVRCIVLSLSKIVELGKYMCLDLFCVSKIVECCTNTRILLKNTTFFELSSKISPIFCKMLYKLKNLYKNATNLIKNVVQNQYFNKILQHLMKFTKNYLVFRC